IRSPAARARADRSRSRTSPRRGAGLPPLDCVSSLASIHGGACVLMRKLLLQLDSSRLPSVFDRVVAYDGGADEVMSYGGVTDADVRDLIHVCIFTRCPKYLKNTAVFVGGADIAVGEQLLTAATKAMFKPFTVSAMLDSNGSNTTAVAAVAKMQQAAGGGDVRGKRVLIVAGTGPVGMRAAGLFAKAVADVNAVPPLGIEGVNVTDDGVTKEGVVCLGALAIGNLKMKVHKACIARLFERNDLVLDAETIADVARELVAAQQ